MRRNTCCCLCRSTLLLVVIRQYSILEVRKSSAFYLISYVFYSSKFPVVVEPPLEVLLLGFGYSTFRSTRLPLFCVLLLISYHIFSCLLLASVSRVIFSLLGSQGAFITSFPSSFVITKHSFHLCSHIAATAFRLEPTIYFHHVRLEQRPGRFGRSEHF